SALGPRLAPRGDKAGTHARRPAQQTRRGRRQAAPRRGGAGERSWRLLDLEAIVIPQLACGLARLRGAPRAEGVVPEAGAHGREGQHAARRALFHADKVLPIARSNRPKPYAYGRAGETLCKGSTEVRGDILVCAP